MSKYFSKYFNIFLILIFWLFIKCDIILYKYILYKKVFIYVLTQNITFVSSEPKSSITKYQIVQWSNFKVDCNNIIYVCNEWFLTIIKSKNEQFDFFFIKSCIITYLIFIKKKNRIFKINYLVLPF